MTDSEKIPVLAVVGPTASGKTSLGVMLAKAYHGEVVSADSMQIYQGLDVGTAKVTPEEMQGVPHHLSKTDNCRNLSPKAPARPCRRNWPLRFIIAFQRTAGSNYAGRCTAAKISGIRQRARQHCTA